jgi:predicted Zn-dependent protease
LLFHSPSKQIEVAKACTASAFRVLEQEPIMCTPDKRKYGISFAEKVCQGKRPGLANDAYDQSPTQDAPMDETMACSAPFRTPRRRSRKWAVVIGMAAVLTVTGLGCMPGGQGPRQGPGHRRQRLLLTPEQELSLGRQAYKEVLDKARQEGTLLPQSDPRVQRVRRVGERIKRAAYIRPLQREINFDVSNYHYDWNFNVIRSNQVNAFCLPACEVVVYTGLLQVADTDDQLATVIGHEVAHALAHHASERLARENMFGRAVEAATGNAMSQLPDGIRKKLLGLLAGGAQLFTRKYDREQESEADHIGIFLMTFARYDPDQALFFWQKMSRLAADHPHPPAILSTHPSDAQRIKQIRAWIPYARAGLRAYDSGDYVRD